jgi:hypothetical protein
MQYSPSMDGYISDNTITEPFKTNRMPMAQNATPLSLLTYLYREASPEETRAIQQELAIDALLREHYVELEQAVRLLPKVTFAPADPTLDHILEYSRSSRQTVTA